MSSLKSLFLLLSPLTVSMLSFFSFFLPFFGAFLLRNPLSLLSQIKLLEVITSQDRHSSHRSCYCSSHRPPSYTPLQFQNYHFSLLAATMVFSLLDFFSVFLIILIVPSFSPSSVFSVERRVILSM